MKMLLVSLYNVLKKIVVEVSKELWDVLRRLFRI